MNELIELLKQFIDLIKVQIKLFNEFTVVLDQEESAIAEYAFLKVEKAIILKNQHIKLLESLEEKRIKLLKKICYMIAFDSRGQNLSLKLFKNIFETYVENVKSLLEKNDVDILQNIHTEFLEITNEFHFIFECVSKRIYRNEMILKKIIRHVNLSLNLFQTEAQANMNYDAAGKAQSALSQQNKLSSIRVSV